MALQCDRHPVLVGLHSHHSVEVSSASNRQDGTVPKAGGHRVYLTKGHKWPLHDSSFGVGVRLEFD